MQIVSVFGFVTLGLCAASTVVPRNNAIRKGNFEAQIPRVIGGKPAGANEFTSTAYIEMYDGTSNGGICTGSLIAPNVVLTAGHCTYIDETSKFTASEFQVGFTHTMPDPMVLFKGYSVSKVITHPKFSMYDLVDDIALLILKDSIPSSVAPTIKIYDGEFYLETPLRAAGFGVTDPLNDTSVPTELMAVDLGVGKSSLCSRNSDTYTPKTQICTDGTEGKDTCQGDSGGPLVTPTDDKEDSIALLGLTSYGTVNSRNPSGLCAAKGASGFYTYIAPYLSWIAEEANLDAKSISVTNRTSSGTSVDGSSSDSSDEESESDDESDSDDDDDNTSSRITNVSANDYIEGEGESDTSSGAAHIQISLTAFGVAAMSMLL
ncbi:serine protease [Coemansia guatemalensis]|uniref:Serine protease n=1 Tax=Coemansia guatemalensis TaxID=2761395 RepID=A0A9W8LRE5_9FUNG|nr:serine protease [Coemansia guatemalensis]